MYIGLKKYIKSKSAENTYNLAIQNGHTEELQEAACKEPEYAYWYAMVVKGAGIDYCQDGECKDSC